MEFALNLDPTFAERVKMTAGSGVRGLPLARLQNSGGQRLTCEFVRRTSGLAYIVEFSTDLVTWTAGGTSTVTGINPRWERVKISDTVTTGSAPKRFVRLRVEL